MKDNKYLRRYFIPSLVLLSVLIIDIFIPLGVAVGVLYVCSIVLLIYEKEKIILFFSILSTFFILLVLILTATRDPTWTVYVNRYFSIITIWVLYYVSVKHKRLSERNKIYMHQLEQKNMQLERSEFLLNEAGRMAKIGAWEFDLATQKTRWSDQVFELHAIPVGDVPDFDYIMGSYIEGSEEILRKSIEECIKMRKIYELELRFMNARNEKLWVRAIGYPIINEKEEIISLRGVVQDITELKRAEAEIMNKEKRFGELVNSLNSGIVVHAPDTSILFNNPRAAELLGLSNDQLLGKQAFDPEWKFLHEDKKPYSIDEFPVNQIMSSKSPIIYMTVGVVRPQTKDIAWLLVNGFPVLDNENEIKEVIVSFIDITEEKNSIEKLTVSQQRYKTLFENQPTIIWEEDFSLVKQGFDQLKNEGVNNFREYFDNHPDVVMELAAKVKIIEINKTSLEILEAETKDEIIKNLSYYFDSDEALKVFKEELIYLAEGSILFESEIPVRTIKGNNKQLYLKLVVHPDYTQDLKRVLITFQDITDLKESTLQLTKYAERLSTTLESISDAFISLDTNWCYTYMNKKAGELFGRNPEEMIGKHIWTEFPEGVGQLFYHAYYKAVETQEFQFLREYYPPYNLWFENRIYPSKDGLSIFFTDITETKKQEIEIQEYQKSLQLLTTEISLIEEKQRKKIAENIHDHLSQSLVISKMKLADLKKENISELNKAEIQSVLNHISTALENSRKITYDLSPPILYELGLIETMYWLVEKIEEENKLKVIFVTELTDIDLPEQKLILIYRIIQELVNNIVKHAKASKIDITFGSKREGIEITVIDNGEGFDVNKLAKVSIEQGGFGLFAVKERVRNLGGTFAIDTKKGEGTNVKFYIPLKSI